MFYSVRWTAEEDKTKQKRRGNWKKMSEKLNLRTYKQIIEIKKESCLSFSVPLPQPTLLPGLLNKQKNEEKRRFLPRPNFCQGCHVKTVSINDALKFCRGRSLFQRTFLCVSSAAPNTPTIICAHCSTGKPVKSFEIFHLCSLLKIFPSKFQA